MVTPGAFAEDCTPDNILASGLAVLGIEYKEFNRLLDESWSHFDEQSPCKADNADLIAGYKEKVLRRQVHELTYREMQFAAASGQTERAIALLQDVLAGETAPLMVHYREAELAFLQRDKAALQMARDRLSNLPETERFSKGVARFKTSNPDLTPPVWPPNLNVVDRFLKCFEYSYREAYNGCVKSDPH